MTNDEWLAECGRERQRVAVLYEKTFGRKLVGPIYDLGATIGEPAQPRDLYSRCVVRRRMRVIRKPSTRLRS